MIDLYTGTPGSGKTLNSMRAIRDYYKSGKYVITNFDIVLFWEGKSYGKHLRMNNDDITVERLQRISELWKKHKGRIKEEEILIVVDEAQLLFNTRDWGDKNRRTWISFFSQHRKLGYHVILICQNDIMIDKQIRTLVEYEYINRKASNIGWSGKIVSTIMGGGSFVTVKLFKPMKLKIGSEIWTPDKELYQMYDTFTTF